MSNPSRAEIAELRKLSSDFRAVFSRAARSENETALQNLRRLYTFVESSPILAAAVKAAPKPLQNPMEELEAAKAVQGRMDFPLDESEELGFVHALISELCNIQGNELWHISRFYAGKMGFDSVPELLGDILEPYFSHLNRVLEHRMIDAMESDKHDRGIRVDISGGTPQVNIAQDSARLSARQRISHDLQEISDTAARLLHSIQSSETVDHSELREVTEAVVEETSRDKPRRTVLQTFVDRIRTLAAATSGGVEIVKHTNSLADQISTLIHHMK